MPHFYWRFILEPEKRESAERVLNGDQAAVRVTPPGLPWATREVSADNYFPVI
jgi:hypothetical protein